MHEPFTLLLSVYDGDRPDFLQRAFSSAVDDQTVRPDQVVIVRDGPVRAELAACLDLVTTQPAKLMNLSDYGVAAGNPADLIVLDCSDAAMAIAEVAHPLLGFKRGRRSFTRAAPVLYSPA